MNSPFLSVIIPAYNEENRLPRTLEQVFTFLKKQSYQAEVLVVENGSTDGTLAAARAFAEQYPSLRVYQEPHSGKGLAVRRGVNEARGEYLFLCDADLSMPVEEIAKFLPPALTDFDIAIASREAPGAVRHDEPAYRHLTGRVFNTLIRWLVLPRIQDTQCGFKCFRARAARQLFESQTLMGWSFDVEILFLAHRRGLKVREVPIHWYYNGESKVSILRDSLRMFLDLLLIRRNARRGLYDPKP
ncbi:MAG: dolichyl-phosphate beta-glucosyltransferase [Chloroflexota bacterium]